MESATISFAGDANFILNFNLVAGVARNDKLISSALLKFISKRCVMNDSQLALRTFLRSGSGIAFHSNQENQPERCTFLRGELDEAHHMTYDFTEFEKDVTITGENGLKLFGILAIPPKSKSMVVFAHGSGSSRLSSRNNFVARVLQQHQHATLLMDLLSEDEAKSRDLVFNIPLLAGRLNFAKSWLQTQKECGALPIAFFGASTGAAAALVAAAQDPEGVFAVVSRGGRPDLAGNFLSRVRAPTLLIVGAADEVVLDLNARAASKLHCPNDIRVIPGATHLFEEPRALEKVAKLAAEWLDREISEVSTKKKLIGESYEVPAAGIF